MDKIKVKFSLERRKAYEEYWNNKKGKAPWNKGLKGLQTHTEQWKKNQSIIAKSNSKMKETQFKKGHKKNLGIGRSLETINKIRLANLGKHLSNETKSKIKESLIGKNLGKKRSEDFKNRISLMKIGRKHSEETRLKMKESWNTIEKRQFAKNRRSKQTFPLKDSSIEIKIQDYLKQLGITFFTHQYLKEIEHSYQCDIFIPSMNLIIECDGDYWHKYPIGREIDNIRTSELISKGFKVLRLWEHEIRAMDINKFMERIKL